MSADMKGMGRRLEAIQEFVKQGTAAADSWEDAKSQEFLSLMGRIARSLDEPVATLNGVYPKLEYLAALLEEYNAKHIGF